MHVSFFYSRLQLLTVRLFWHNLQFRHDSFDTTFSTIFLTFFPDSGVNLPTFTRAEEHHNKMAATSSARVLPIHKHATNKLVNETARKILLNNKDGHLRLDLHLSRRELGIMYVIKQNVSKRHAGKKSCLKKSCQKSGVGLGCKRN